MPLNAAALATEIFNNVNVAMANFDSPADNHQLGGFDRATTEMKWCTAIATAVVAHFQANAKATGTDSGGDSHNLSIT